MARRGAQIRGLTSPVEHLVCSDTWQAIIAIGDVHPMILDTGPPRWQSMPQQSWQQDCRSCAAEGPSAGEAEVGRECCGQAMAQTASWPAELSSVRCLAELLLLTAGDSW